MTNAEAIEYIKKNCYGEWCEDDWREAMDIAIKALEVQEWVPVLVTFAITEGNPGALSFVMAAYAKDLCKAEHGFKRMQDAGITGSRLYMLWNDCCNRDTEMAMDIMSNKAIDVILHHIDDGHERGIPFEKKC